jgi:hypothetical protein
VGLSSLHDSGQLTKREREKKPDATCSRTRWHFVCSWWRTLANLEFPDRSNGSKSGGDRRDKQSSHSGRADGADHRGHGARFELSELRTRIRKHAVHARDPETHPTSVITARLAETHI